MNQTQTTFSTWTEIKRMSGVEHMLAEDAVLETVNHDKLAAILEEDGGLVQIEGIRFTPGGDFVKALTRTGDIIEAAIELVS